MLFLDFLLMMVHIFSFVEGCPLSKQEDMLLDDKVTKVVQRKLFYRKSAKIEKYNASGEITLVTFVVVVCGI